ncbi:MULTISPECIES: TonB-dependent receptor [unclassified Sphingobium]|uniref:TonB-dependent receptor n=1 Tax=unclassified Sphingobium TaxID=2611147 RepID=UPI00076FE0AA|nr:MULTISPECIES: TonB-dependent receptor [unclassified Sphingobium]AMK21871.1 TonB-dependent receptor [Sphingobium sp. TKS]NML91505.1 TonB-dependent receptor [Sphingobium sp. TB-6]
MAMKPVAFTSASLLALMLAGAAHAQSEAAPQAVPQQDETNDIVVTGVRASIVGALNVRKESTQIVDSIVAEDVGKLPDNNVVEALQRVTGIQVTNRTGGEAAAISIRGLPDALTTLNGRNIFTAAGQSFQLQDVSANLVKRVDVFKTRSADQIETGLAGQVDVETRRPFDFNGFAISGLARGIYNEQADSYNPNVALLVSDRWETGIGDIGLLVNGSYSRTKYRDQTVTAGAFVPFATMTPPAGTGLTAFQRIFPVGRDPITGEFGRAPALGAWDPGLNSGLSTAAGATMDVNGVETPYYLSRDAAFSSDLYGKRERPSFNIALQWAPNSSSVYTAEVFYAGFRGETFNSLQFSFVDYWANPQAPTLYDGTNIVKARTANSVYGFNSGDFTKTSTDSFVYALNGKWDLGDRGKIIGDIAYQTSKVKTSFLAMRTDRVANSIDVDFNAGGGIPSYHFDDDSLLADPGVWNVAQLYDNANRDKGSAITGTLDGYYSWDEGFLRQIKAGIRIDQRKASTAVRTQDAGGPLVRTTLTGLGEGAAFTNSDFYQGRADVPSSWTLANGYWLYDNADTVRGLYGLKTSDQLALQKTFDIDESTIAMYLQADGEVSIFGRPLKLQAGVRYVTVDTDYNFFDRYNGGAQTRVSSGSDRFLPSFTARYEIFDNLRLRFNYGETLRRPNFSDINPNYNLTGDLTNVGYGSGTAGTATLKPTHSKNFDVALEWYFERNSAITLTGFRREIQGLVVPLTVQEYIPNNGIVAGATNNFAITRPVNASNGVLKGLELGLTYFPSYLPGPLNGLGFVGSVTVLDSKQNIPETNSAGVVTGESTSSFFGVSDLSYNATLAYDNGPIGARLSYIWRKEFLANNEARLFANPIGVWRNPEKSLDLQLTWNVNDRLGVTFDAVNLTKSKQQTYYKFEDVGGPDQFNLGTTLLARTFALGVRYTFK